MERYAHISFPFPIIFSCFFFFTIFFIHGLLASSSQLNQTQVEIMRNLSKTLNSLTGSNSEWNTTNPDPCSWERVTCSPQSSPDAAVTQLSFSGLGLSTTKNSSFSTLLFDLICGLNTLEHLDLSLNSITTLPESFFADCVGLSGLKSLNLSYNGLDGALGNFSNFAGLETLDLSFNHLTGPVHNQFDSLSRLKSLNLSSNRMVGTVQSLLGGGKVLTLEELVLSSNNFSGNIPNSVSEYANLTLLDLSQNSFNGSLPNGFGEFPKLETLLLSSNNLVGDIPASLSGIATLSRFAANENKFSGTIPGGLTKYMRILDLSYNQLGGEIPSDLLSPPSLESVDLTGNHLEGAIPANLSQGLYRLRLGGNLLNGTIPEAIGLLSGLKYLELEGNKLDSGIPSQIGDCENLTLLNLADNRLRGGIPKELGNLRQLVELELQMNNLSGGIPNEIFQLSSLSTLNLSRNSFSGEISSAISGLKKLTNLDLNDNMFFGSIPSSINNLNNLIELQLGNNNLSGTVPPMPSSLTIALNLSSNLFGGSIPSYLGSLSELEVLDLSHNNFSGEVPNSLTKLQSLTLLVLSYNRLSGVLPQFPPYVNVITNGNVDLIGTNDGTGTVTKKKRSSLMIIILAIIGAFLGLGLIAAVLLYVFSKRFYRVEDEGIEISENPPQIVDGCFVTSNSIHRSAIDFSKAMEAVSDPRNVTLKTRFCTYYKAAMPNGTSYSVKKLNWSDKSVPSGTHEKFGQELESLGRLSSSNVMVPLAYVLTEDSAYLFYENAHEGTLFEFLHRSKENILDWSSRYSIALGVAQGLTFLHGCAQPVLLLDLSTLTIHLKSTTEPQVGDIELCKVIDPSKSTGSLSTVAGSVGYIPPEYAYTMRLTMSGNVYSFGVILLELLTGKPPVSEGVELAKWALSYSTRRDQREQILDPRVSKASLGVRSQMLSVLKVALACVNLSPEARPKMRHVLSMLFNAK
ncbi:LRR receptor-like serine/threonine-protein kinase GSO1 [Ananas comosus]|uniref:LRR receptor-like serine/threonine-protein kinase GSO1 n=1 Tax=Ananas comosus TaxID=4615 RepID=A0A6P5EK59_ANACO|nr:LRR receptor-like serine/threonine-protein kinase GSO1 [Ananas comosus]XP_020111737.1 LRR receptor-like serine/threonine-protein kinase GSO1 [Ananas comosus]